MAKKERLYYLDWLRVLAFWLLILFHTWQPFSHFHWLIESNYQTTIADILTIYTHGWRLHLIFFVSGIGTWFAIGSHKKNFFKDRFLRLMIPFIFASLLIVPSQRYYQRLQNGEIFDSFWRFMNLYPSQVLQNDYGFSILLWCKEIGIHLWYLPYLLIMTLVCFPILKKVKQGNFPIKKIKSILDKPYGIFVLAIPLFLIRLLLKPIFPNYTDWADFFTYVWSFLYGFILINNHSELIIILQKNQKKFLVVGLICSLTLIVGSTKEELVATYLNPEFNYYHILISFLNALIAFSWTMFFVSLFSKKMNFKKEFLTEANTSILPIYILHQSIIVCFGYYIIAEKLGAFVEFTIILILTTISCLLLFKIITKIGILRFLFGMKSKK